MELLKKQKLSISIFLAISIVFFIWIKYAQLTILNNALTFYYPTKFYLIAILIGFLFNFLIWMIVSIVIYFFSATTKFTNLFRLVGISFSVFITGPILFSYQQANPQLINMLNQIHPLQVSVMSFVFIILLIIISNISLVKIMKYYNDLIILFSLYCLYFYLIIVISPFYFNEITGWIHEWDGMSHGVSLKYLIDASNYSLTWIDQSYAMGTYPVPFHAKHSYIVGIISLLFGVTPIDMLGRLFLYKGMFFIIIVLSSFFFYLYLKYGLKMSYFVSFFGGTFYLLSNTTLLNQLNYYSVSFWFPFFVLPLVLLLLSLSANRGKLVYSAMAGFCFSASICIFQASPDNHRIVFWFILLPYSFTVFIITFKKQYKSIALYFICFIVFLVLGYSVLLLPMYNAFISGEQFFYPYNFFGVQWSYDYILDILKKIFLIEYNLPSEVDSIMIVQNGGKHLLFSGHYIILFILVFISINKINVNEIFSRKIFLFWAILSLYVLHIILLGDKSLTHFFMQTFATGYIRSLYRFSPIWHFCILMVILYSLEHIVQSRTQKLDIAISIYLVIFVFIILKDYVLVESIYDFLADGKLINIIMQYKISIITSLCAILLLVRLRNEPIFVNKLFFIIGSILISININPDSYQSTSKNLLYQSMDATLYHYESVKDDPRTINYILTKIYPFIKDYRDLNTKNELIEYMKKHAKDIDSYYFNNNTNIQYPPQLVNFNNLIPKVQVNNNEYWMSLPDRSFPMSTFPAFDIVKWFGAHGLIKTSNRSYHLYSKHIEWGYSDKVHDNTAWRNLPFKSYDIDDLYLKSYDIAGISYIAIQRSSYFRFQQHKLVDILNDNGYAEIANNSFNNQAFSIYYNPNSFGRVYFANKIYQIPYLAIEKMNPKTESDLYKQKINEAQDYIMNLKYKEAVVENIDSDTVDVINKQGNEGAIKNISIKTNKAVFEVSVPSDKSFLVYNTGALKDWVAYVDDKQVPIYFANIAFMGVEVPKGEHLVWFEYRPTAKILGLFIVLITAIFLCLWLIYDSIKHSKAG